jgi:hypothetical protein
MIGSELCVQADLCCLHGVARMVQFRSYALKYRFPGHGMRVVVLGVVFQGSCM